VSRLGDDQNYHAESAKMLATTIHMMNGTPYIYQGEEIGMTNPNFADISDYRDVESLNAYEIMKNDGKSDPEIIGILKQKSRDNARTPMQWSAEKNAGFTTETPWISVANNYPEINAEKAFSESDSIFNHYKELIALRKQYPIIVHGDFKMLLEDHQSVFAYTRNWENETILVVNNFYGEEVTVGFDLKTAGNVEVLISNYEDSQLTLDELTLRPYESVVYYVR
jgi:trehalose-6-phosphate hydrolase